MVESIKSNDGLVRGAKVKVGKTRNVIRCPVDCLYPTEVRYAPLNNYIVIYIM